MIDDDTRIYSLGINGFFRIFICLYLHFMLYEQFNNLNVIKFRVQNADEQVK